MTEAQPLLPDRHPTRDFFVADIFDSLPFKDDMASMSYPMFSLSKKKDMRNLEYQNGGWDNQLARYPGDAHLITFAPTGSGKGVSAVIPNLLDYQGSVICIDPKGENAAITVRRRDKLDV